MFVVRPIVVQAAESDDPIELFCREASPVQNFIRNACFYRLVGMKGEEKAYIERIVEMDRHFQTKGKGNLYIRIDEIMVPPPGEDFSGYAKIYENWKVLKGGNQQEMLDLKFPFAFQDKTLEWTCKIAYEKVLQIFETNTRNLTESMMHNFALKLLYWMDIYLPHLFKSQAKVDDPPAKILYVGDIKKHGSLFLYFLMLLGCDVLYMNSKGDMPSDYGQVVQGSRLCKEGSLKACKMPVPEFDPEPRTVSAQRQPGAAPIVAPPSAAASPAPLQVRQQQASIIPPGPVPVVAGREMSYEELAQLSVAVVMIKVFDDAGECMKTGSGVAISPKGYILTNCHVVSGSTKFSLRFENDSKEHFTASLVKYHQDYDLALIKTDPLYHTVEVLREGNLVRGQKVVAIGSPLGLFNTVSDGIISGFRDFEQQGSMIQFTAPISRGSSGGALLDLRGRLIGLLTAGFDDGQNLNLAVDYKTILSFTQNFL